MTSAASSPTNAIPGDRKLSASEWRTYNHMAEHMDMFHNHFRYDWDLLYKAAESNKRPDGMSLRAFMTRIDQFCSQLTVHHTIEERHIFPTLAKKDPAFREELELLTQHKMIHEGLDKLTAFVNAARSGESEFRMSELKNIMDSFGTTLFAHLDAEVARLGADNMKLYWTPQEMRTMPM